MSWSLPMVQTDVTLNVTLDVTLSCHPKNS